MIVCTLLQSFLEGKAPLPLPRVTDVRDVARAHILAAELAQAHGRYIIANPYTYDQGEVWEALNRRFPDAAYPKEPYGSHPVLDNSKVRWL